MSLPDARSRLATALLALALLTAGCARAQEPSPNGASKASVAAAESFVAALDDGDVRALVRLSRAPFAFREQAWTNAPDGSGFVLAEASDRVLAEDSALEPLFAELVQRVRTRSRTAAPNPSPREVLLGEQLAGAPPAWRRLELVVFLRGEGDVEHIAIVGVDPRSGRVAGLYVN